MIVHPECPRPVVEAADEDGSTEYIIRRCEELPAGASAVIGTDWNLVNRLRLRYPDKRISCLKEDICPCVTMNRIDLPKLTWCLESLAAGELVNSIRVDEDMRRLGPGRPRPDARPGVTVRELVVARRSPRTSGERGDITSALARARRPAGRRRGWSSRAEGVLAGRAAAEEVCRQTGIAGRWRAEDGARLRPGTVVAELSGPARAVLTAERTLLNLLCRLSGVATLTAAYVEACAPVAVLDTRKTTPGMRALEKAAVAAGGGVEPPDGALRPGAGEGQPPGPGRRRAGRRGGPRAARAARTCSWRWRPTTWTACGAASTPAPTGSCSTT